MCYRTDPSPESKQHYSGSAPSSVLTHLWIYVCGNGFIFHTKLIFADATNEYSTPLKVHTNMIIKKRESHFPCLLSPKFFNGFKCLTDHLGKFTTLSLYINCNRFHYDIFIIHVIYT